MAIYEGLFMFVNGILMAQNVSVDTDLVADDQDVETLPLGWTGISPASNKRTISFENVIPVTGFDIDLEQKFLDKEEVEIRLQFGGTGKKTTTKGYFNNVAITAGVGKVTSIAAAFRGTAEAFA